MPPLYFLHIPKTSGTSLSSYLDARFRSEEILPATVWSQHLDSLTPSRRSPFARSMRGAKLVRGHFGRGVWRELDQPPTVITMLREPIERTLSIFHHADIERRWNNFVPADFYREPFCLDAVMSDDRARYFRNQQARHLAVDVDVKAAARKAINGVAARLDCPPSHAFNLDSLPEFVNCGLSDGELAELAWEELKRIRFFGLQKYHQASVLLLADTFGWPPERIGNRMMVGSDRPAAAGLPDRSLEAIAANNRADVELYARASHLFLERYSRLATRLLDQVVTVGDVSNSEQEITERCLGVLARVRAGRQSRAGSSLV